MGYTGKQIIHPGQIDIVQEAFLPSKEKIKWAKGLIDAFNEHQTIGKVSFKHFSYDRNLIVALFQSIQGAFVYKNQMIDMPTVKQALNVINLINQVNE